MADLDPDLVLGDDTGAGRKTRRPIARITTLEDQHQPMGNRHHHKKLRAAIRAAMAKSGESYQQALCRMRRETTTLSAPTQAVDLIPIDYFGFQATLATFALLEGLSCIVTPGNHSPLPFPRSPLFALARPRNLS